MTDSRIPGDPDVFVIASAVLTALSRAQILEQRTRFDAAGTEPQSQRFLSICSIPNREPDCARLCAGTRDRRRHFRPLRADRAEPVSRGVLSRALGGGPSMIDGMLAEPWHLRGHQEARLREFLQLIEAG
jgi:hypothetical protein